VLDLVSVLVLSLATWRISSLLVVEDGPWRIFRSIRKAVYAGEFSLARIDGERLTEEEAAQVMLSAGLGEGFFSGLLSCMWCTSMWVAAAIVILYLLWPSLVWLLLIPALSAVAIAIDEAIE